MSAIRKSTATAEAERLVSDWATTRRWTDEQYLLFANDDNARVELSDGKLEILAMPTPAHQAVVLNVAVALRASALGRVFVAPVPVRLWPGKFREPDVVFFRQAHLDRVGAQSAGVPDLAVEVLSPSTRHLDLGLKMDEYAEAGVAEYWVVELDAHNVSVYGLRDGQFVLSGRYRAGERVTSSVVTDVAIAVDVLFA